MSVDPDPMGLRSPSAKRVIVTLGSAVPTTVIKGQLVTSALAITGCVKAIVTIAGTEAILVQPNAVDTAVILYVPGSNDVISMLKLPAPSVDPDAIEVGSPLAKRSIVTLGSAVPVTSTVGQTVTSALVIDGCCIVKGLNTKRVLVSGLAATKQLLAEKATEVGFESAGSSIGLP